MSEVQFEEDGPVYKPGAILNNQPTSKMIAYLIKHRIVKSEAAANGLLLAFAIVLFCISAFVIIFYNSGYGIPDDSKAKAEAWQNYLRTAPKLPSDN